MASLNKQLPQNYSLSWKLYPDDFLCFQKFSLRQLHIQNIEFLKPPQNRVFQMLFLNIIRLLLSWWPRQIDIIGYSISKLSRHIYSPCIRVRRRAGRTSWAGRCPAPPAGCSCPWSPSWCRTWCPSQPKYWPVIGCLYLNTTCWLVTSAC